MFAGRQCDAAGRGQLRSDQEHGAVTDREDAAERQFLAGVAEPSRQAERRVGEVQRPVRAVHQVMGAVQPLSYVTIGEHGDVTVRLDADDAPVPVLANGEPPVRVEGEPVGAGLGVFPDVCSGVAALRAENSDHADWVPAVDDIGAGRAEKQRAVACPYRARGELKATSHPLEAGGGRHDCLERAGARGSGDYPYGYLLDGARTTRSVEV